LYKPRSVALDADGNLYIADWKDRRIRRVDAKTGIITTVAGGGRQPRSIPQHATETGFAPLWAVAVDPGGNLWFSDESACLYRVDLKTGILSTHIDANGGQGKPLAGSPIKFGPIRELAVDRNGNLYFPSGYGHVLRYNPGQKAVSVVAGGGKTMDDGVPAWQAMLGNLQGLAIDGKGNLYFAVYGRTVIRRVTDNGTVETVFGPDRSLSLPAGMAFDPQGGLLFTRAGGNRVYRIDLNDRTVTLVAGDGWQNGLTGDGRFAGDGAPATQASLWAPIGIAVDAQGNIYIADSGNNRIRKVDAATGIITTVAGRGEPALPQP